MRRDKNERCAQGTEKPGIQLCFLVINSDELDWGATLNRSRKIEPKMTLECSVEVQQTKKDGRRREIRKHWKSEPADAGADSQWIPNCERLGGGWVLPRSVGWCDECEYKKAPYL